MHLLEASKMSNKKGKMNGSTGGYQHSENNDGLNTLQ